MKLAEIQGAIAGIGADGWLFYDHHHRDPMAYSVLGLDASSMTTRRWFYFVPAKGEPVKLSHRVEPRKLDPLPGRQEFFTGWRELQEKLRAILGSPRKVAMQYSPMNNIPYVGIVDAGTVEMVRSLGHEVVTSADLIQRFEATTDEAGRLSHHWAGDRVLLIKDEAFGAMADALYGSSPVTEYGMRELILRRFEEEGLTSEGAPPIVGFNDHPADPHFEPVQEGTYTLKPGDTILLDLWARRVDPPGFYYDITWCAFAGEKAPKQYEEIFTVVRDARDAALEFIRERFSAGTPVHGWEVDDACRAVVTRAGYGERFLHRTGHSIGVSVHGNGANMDNLETRDDRRIVPGTCFSIEPGIYLEGSMAVRSEINVFITPAGSVEVYGPMQHELFMLG